MLFERVIEPKLEALQRRLGSLDHVEVTDAYSGTIVYRRNSSPLWWCTPPWKHGRHHLQEIDRERRPTPCRHLPSQAAQRPLRN